MRLVSATLHAVWVTALLISCSLCAPADAADEPLVIAKQGNFYVGGKYVESNGDVPMVGQVFVEFQIPQRQTHPFPIVMIHGGGQTGSGWISTPDGREGWAQYFLRRGYAIYVVDQVARGRSAYIAGIYGAPRAQTREYVMQRFSTMEKYNLWPQAKLHTQWPDNAEPGNPVFDNYFASNVPSMENREMQGRMNVDALAALLDRIGPAIVLVHSQSGQYGWPLAQARPALVRAIVGAEPTGPPVHDLVVPGAARFGMDFANATAVDGTAQFRDDPRLKRYGLSDIPMEYSPPVTAASPLTFVQQDKAEGPDLASWRQGAGAQARCGWRSAVLYLREASSTPQEPLIKLQQAGINVDFPAGGSGARQRSMMMMEKTARSRNDRRNHQERAPPTPWRGKALRALFRTRAAEQT